MTFLFPLHHAKTNEYLVLHLWQDSSNKHYFVSPIMGKNLYIPQHLWTPVFTIKIDLPLTGMYTTETQAFNYNYANLMIASVG